MIAPGLLPLALQLPESFEIKIMNFSQASRFKLCAARARRGSQFAPGDK
jgi:hypothetical protein